MEPSVRFLEDELRDRIIDEARSVLAGQGILVAGEEATGILHGHGARVGNDGRVRIPEALVERALSSAPDTLRLEGTDPRHTLTLGDGSVHFTPGSAALSIVDWPSGEARTPRTADYVRYARVADGLAHIESQSTALIPGDVPQAVSDSYRLYLSLRHGSKPVVTGTFSPAGYPVMRDLLRAARGGARALRERPLALFTVCPTSPLSWSREALVPFLACVRDGIPVEIVSMPLAGFSAPVTLVGTLTQHTAEVLSGVVLGQLAAPGVPMLFGSSAAAFDVRFGSTPMGAVETMILGCAVSEVGRALGLPTQAYIGLSDAKVLDAQAGFETGMGMTLAALAGIHQCSGPGMLDFESCHSLEKLVVDNEICGAVQRLRRGVTPRDDFPAAPRVAELLSEGHLLVSKHSLDHLGAEHFLPHRVVDRLPRPRWQEDGAPTLGERAAGRIRALLEAWTPPPLDAGTLDELHSVMSGAAAAAGLAALPEEEPPPGDPHAERAGPPPPEEPAAGAHP